MQSVWGEAACWYGLRCQTSSVWTGKTLRRQNQVRTRFGQKHSNTLELLPWESTRGDFGQNCLTMSVANANWKALVANFKKYKYCYYLHVSWPNTFMPDHTTWPMAQGCPCFSEAGVYCGEVPELSELSPTSLKGQVCRAYCRWFTAEKCTRMPLS